MADARKAPSSPVKKGPPKPSEATRYIRPMCIILAENPEHSGQTVSIVVTSTQADGSRVVIEVPNLRAGETCIDLALPHHMPE